MHTPSTLPMSMDNEHTQTDMAPSTVHRCHPAKSHQLDLAPHNRAPCDEAALQKSGHTMHTTSVEKQPTPSDHPEHTNAALNLTQQNHVHAPLPSQQGYHIATFSPHPLQTQATCQQPQQHQHQHQASSCTLISGPASPACSSMSSTASEDSRGVAITTSSLSALVLPSADASASHAQRPLLAGQTQHRQGVAVPDKAAAVSTVPSSLPSSLSSVASGTMSSCSSEHSQSTSASPTVPATATHQRGEVPASAHSDRAVSNAPVSASSRSAAPNARTATSASTALNAGSSSSPTSTSPSSGTSSYPVRIGAADCQYYLKTGKCNYGSRCKFNHPHRDERLVSALNRRDCFDFVQTGTCPYGKSCKYNHPARTDILGSPVSSAPNMSQVGRSASPPRVPEMVGLPGPAVPMRSPSSPSPSPSPSSSTPGREMSSRALHRKGPMMTAQGGANSSGDHVMTGPNAPSWTDMVYAGTNGGSARSAAKNPAASATQAAAVTSRVIMAPKTAASVVVQNVQPTAGTPRSTPPPPPQLSPSKGYQTSAESSSADYSRVPPLTWPTLTSPSEMDLPSAWSGGQSFSTTPNTALPTSSSLWSAHSTPTHMSAGTHATAKPMQAQPTVSPVAGAGQSGYLVFVPGASDPGEARVVAEHHAACASANTYVAPPAVSDESSAAAVGFAWDRPPTNVNPVDPVAIKHTWAPPTSSIASAGEVPSNSQLHDTTGTGNAEHPNHQFMQFSPSFGSSLFSGGPDMWAPATATPTSTTATASLFDLLSESHRG